MKGERILISMTIISRFLLDTVGRKRVGPDYQKVMFFIIDFWAQQPQQHDIHFLISLLLCRFSQGFWMRKGKIGLGWVIQIMQEMTGGASKHINYIKSAS